MNFKCFFLENELKGKNLVIVDIQPEYNDYIPFSIENFSNWLNKNYENFNKVLFLFNGPDLGMISEQELKFWYSENGMSEEIIDESDFFDKGDAFFRYCMDEGIDEDDIVILVKFMIESDVYDSRDITELDLWDEFEKKYNNKELRELLEYSSDLINIPDVMEVLKKYGNNIAIIGGGANECLKEVEIALKANGQNFVRLAEWVY